MPARLKSQRLSALRPVLDAQPETPRDNDVLKLDNQLCFALYTAVNRVTRLYWPELKALGLTYPQYIVLLALWERSPQTVGGLGEMLDLNSGTLTPLLKRLERQGIIRRYRDDKDQRRSMVALTEQGQALRARAAKVPVAMMCKLLLPVGELRDLRDRVKRFNASLGNRSGKGENADMGRREPESSGS